MFCNMHVGIFELEPVKVIWGHSVHLSEKLGRNSKQLIVERNGRKFGPRGCMYMCNMHFGIFHLEHVKVFWGHSVYCSIKGGMTRKWLIK